MFVISRDNNGTVRGATRCYVTGPHFGHDVWSGTLDPSLAATWATEEEALAERATRHWSNVRVIPLADAPQLET